MRMDKRGIVEDGCDWERGTEMAVFRSNHAAGLVYGVLFSGATDELTCPVLVYLVVLTFALNL